MSAGLIYPTHKLLTALISAYPWERNMKNRLCALGLVLALGLVPISVIGAVPVSSPVSSPVVLESSDSPPTFLELYTSQGCSSCPPAERWLSKFTSDKALWSAVIPVNFHVDYWDYLGWKDPFAKEEFTQRQRMYQALGRAKTVATPGFIVDGKGWNGWFYKQSLQLGKINGKNTIKPPLHASIENGQVNIAFDLLDTSQMIAHVAILGFGIETPIKYGENKGRNLKHDFVVIGYSKQKLQDKSGKSVAQLSLPETIDVATSARGIAIWITSEQDIAAIQALGGWLL